MRVIWYQTTLLKNLFFFIFLSSVDGTGYNRKPTESSVTTGHSILYA